MSTQNRLQRMISPLQKLPAPLRSRALTLIFGRLVKFVGTAGLRVETLTPEVCVVSTPNRTRVQNHIGGIHAAAMALLAETSTGLVVGLNVSDHCVPVIKSMKVDYLKRAKGGMRAEARLTSAQRQHLHEQDKGEVNVDVQVFDETGSAPISCAMIWAWVPKKR